MSVVPTEPADDRARADQALAREILARHSKSFALAGKLLPRRCRADAAVLYAWCRRCDDAVDLPPDPRARSAAVARLRAELDQVYRDGPPTGLDPVLRGFQSVVRRHGLPRRWPEDLIAGMEMDVAGEVRYQTVDALLLYAYRAAGTVGLMMAHLMGARGDEALRRAADLGIAMQLTNICRDVAEDAVRGRVYVPAELLAARAPGEGGATRSARAVSELWRRARAFYRSGRGGLSHLPLRSAIGVHAASLIYAEIGHELARRAFDVTAGRVVISRRRKLALALRALLTTVPVVIGQRVAVGIGAFAGRIGASTRTGRTGPRLPALPFSLPLAAVDARRGRPS